jgi:hypothetical protein
MAMDSRQWVEKQLSTIMLATRQNWAVSTSNHERPKIRRHDYGRSFKIINWYFGEEGCGLYIQFQPFPSVVLAHPVLSQIRHFSWLPINERYPKESQKAGLELWLNENINNSSTPIELQEIDTASWELERSSEDSYPPEVKHNRPSQHNKGIIWPKLSGGQIPWEHDALHYVSGIKICHNKLGLEVWYDDIRFHQYGCIEGKYTEAIDRHYPDGVGGQRGSIESFINKIDEIITLRGKNSRILIWQKDYNLLFSAWTSDTSFTQDWERFRQWARNLDSQPSILIDGVMPEQAEYPPPEIKLNCYVFTPI